MELILNLNCKEYKLYDKVIFDEEITDDDFKYANSKQPENCSNEELVEWICEYTFVSNGVRDILDKKYEFEHGECGESDVDIIFKYNDIYFKCYYNIEWDRYDKQFYFIDRITFEKYEIIHPDLNTDGIITKLSKVLNEIGVNVTFDIITKTKVTNINE